jgi:hypothetical protein
MATVSRGIPPELDLDTPKRQARELLQQWRAGAADAYDRIRSRHPRLQDGSDAALKSAALRLSDAQLVIALEYGLSSWSQLKERINAQTIVGALDLAIRADDRNTVVELLRANPNLLHIPLISGNWGPPMSHAANLGRLEVIQAVAELGARDFQHAFDRAILQGKIECARWLREHGAKAAPGIIMGSCETLNPSGIRFLLEMSAPFTDERGDRLAPLALVLETYARNPAGKHEILEILAHCGYDLPDTPIMAFHRGDVSGLQKHLRRDPRLLHQRFALSEIYPTECGCGRDGRSGMHWTPIDGGTLLHLAVDFRERRIFDWLIDAGADVSAVAAIDAAGFGGHTPLFNTVVCGPWRDASMTRALLNGGAAKETRASLRKFLDWTESPRWHEAPEVTAAEWGRGFPEAGWVNADALRLLTCSDPQE